MLYDLCSTCATVAHLNLCRHFEAANLLNNILPDLNYTLAGRQKAQLQNAKLDISRILTLVEM